MGVTVTPRGVRRRMGSPAAAMRDSSIPDPFYYSWRMIAFASAGLFVAGNAVLRAATALRDRMLLLAADHTGVDRASCFLADDTVICGGKRIPVSELNAAAAERGMRLTEARKAYGSPRSVATTRMWQSSPARIACPRTLWRSSLSTPRTTCRSRLSAWQDTSQAA